MKNEKIIHNHSRPHKCFSKYYIGRFFFIIALAFKPFLTAIFSLSPVVLFCIYIFRLSPFSFCIFVDPQDYKTLKAMFLFIFFSLSFFSLILFPLQFPLDTVDLCLFLLVFRFSFFFFVISTPKGVTHARDLQTMPVCPSGGCTVRPSRRLSLRVSI